MVRQCPAWEKPHRDERRVIVVAMINDRDDVVMPKRPHHLNLTGEPGSESGKLATVRVILWAPRHLQDNRASHAEIPRAIGNPHAAYRELGYETISPSNHAVDGFAGHVVGRVDSERKEKSISKTPRNEVAYPLSQGSFQPRRANHGQRNS